MDSLSKMEIYSSMKRIKNYSLRFNLGMPHFLSPNPLNSRADAVGRMAYSRAPLSLLKVRHDQPVELRIAKRLNEKWTRQPAPPSGPFSGSGNRLGSVSPYPDSTPSSSSAAMPGSFSASSMLGQPSQSSSNNQTQAQAQPVPISTNVEFEVDRNEPTTQLQIRLRDGEKLLATFNHSHTVGDIRRYINAYVPSALRILHYQIADTMVEGGM